MVENASFDINDLDPYERRVYDDFIKKPGMTKDRVLLIIINNVEGDWSQLSPALKRYAKAIGEKPNSKIPDRSNWRTNRVARGAEKYGSKE